MEYVRILPRILRVLNCRGLVKREMNTDESQLQQDFGKGNTET
jgi:hypothetical protein